MLPGSIEQEPRQRFAAGTAVFIVVVTSPELIDGQLVAEIAIDSFDLRPIRGAAADIGLIGDDE